MWDEFQTQPAIVWALPWKRACQEYQALFHRNAKTIAGWVWNSSHMRELCVAYYFYLTVMLPRLYFSNRSLTIKSCGVDLVLCNEVWMIWIPCNIQAKDITLQNVLYTTMLHTRTTAVQGLEKYCKSSNSCTTFYVKVWQAICHENWLTAVGRRKNAWKRIMS